MMEVDISNIWGELSLPDLLGLERAVFDAHRAVAETPEKYGLTAQQLEGEFSLYSYENPVWLYTAARKLLFRLGRQGERLAFHGPEAKELASCCEGLPVGEGAFVTLICGGISAEEAAARAEALAAEGDPVITIHMGNPDDKTPEQLRCFFRFSAALWSELPG